MADFVQTGYFYIFRQQNNRAKVKKYDNYFKKFGIKNQLYNIILLYIEFVI